MLGGSIIVSLDASVVVLLPPEHVCTLAEMQLFLSRAAFFLHQLGVQSEFAETKVNTAEYFDVSSLLDPYKC